MSESYVLSEAGSITATQGSGSKIVTFDDRTHVVWQEHRPEGFFNIVRTLDRAAGDLAPPVVLNQGVDDHARPILIADSAGFLHAVLSGHNSPMAYRRSLKANDSSAWTDDVPVGAGTYPVLVCGADDTLYLTLRNADGWSGTDLYLKPPGGDWEPGAKPVRRTDAYAGYATYTNGIAVAADTTLHAVWDFFETEGGDPQYGLDEATGYMRSRDGAGTWERADGSTIELPARPEQMDLLGRHHESFEAINPGSSIASSGAIALDGDDNPIILYLSHVEKPGQLFACTISSRGRWSQTPLELIEQTWPDMRPGRLERGMTRTADGAVHMLLELLPLSEGWDADGKQTRLIGNPDRPGKLLVWLSTSDGARSWSVELALPAGVFFNRANVERAASAIQPAPGRKPAFIYHDGPTRGDGDRVIQSNVYLVTPD